MGFLSALFGQKKGGLTADTVEKTRKFIAPQISVLENTLGSEKYSGITFESMAYAVAIAEFIGKRKLISQEVMPFLLEVFGRDYEQRFTFLFKVLVEDYGVHTIEPNISSRMKDLAANDVKNGIDNCSNFLVLNANEANADLQRFKNIQM